MEQQRQQMSVQEINDCQKYLLDNGQLHREDGPAVIYKDGSRRWYQNDQLHRTDGPAVEDLDGYRAWHFKGLLHREDGPALLDGDGFQAWYKHGLLHRTNGPAIIDDDDDGTIEYFLDGVAYDPVTYLIKCYEQYD
jgi:hypothetical protein